MDFEAFEKELATLRKEKKISQKQLSTDLNISRVTISSFENGGSVDIGFKKVLQIVDYLGLEMQLKEKSP
ncbi:MAG: helix-turn-helix transcriptional regulator [Campylobacterota bacterium]|nr:helix-turn-helix transcriptional regulator [Campylobacterota bacterium]